MPHRSSIRRENFFSTKSLNRRLKTLFRQPIFWLITVWGHACIALGAYGFDHFERGVNPRIQSFLDSVYWAVATFTSVGYGDVVPFTSQGKLIGIGVMVFGTLFLWSYMALFTGAIVAPALKAVEADVNEIERDINSVREDLARLETNWHEHGKESPTTVAHEKHPASDHRDTTEVSRVRGHKVIGSDAALQGAHQVHGQKKGDRK